MNPFDRKLRFWIALVTLVSMSVLDFHPALAALAPSRTSGTTSVTSSRDADMLIAQRTLENKVVAQKLRDYGLSPEEAQLKLAGMSDQDLHTLASASKGLPSGGDGAGALISILLVVLLVIIILKLLNHDVIVR